MELDLDLLLRTFAQEAHDTLDALAEALSALDAAPGDGGQLGAAFRQVHTFKGSAGSLGFQSLRSLAHAAEEVLSSVRDGSQRLTPGLLALLHGTVDRLGAAVDEAVAGREEDTPARRACEQQLLSAARGAPFEAMIPEPASEATRRDPAKTVRVELSKLDRLLDVSAELLTARSGLTMLLSAEQPPVEQLRAAHEVTERLFQDLQELVLGARMVPVGPFLRRFSREVRDLGRALGKPCRLRLDGEDAEIDVLLAEHLRDAIGHLLRNAVDHGLELPVERIAAGKSPFGVVTVRARRDGGWFLVSVADDGRGIDTATVFAKARAAGLLSTEAPETADLERVLFSPGFSTARTVTEVSGRGVGLDVVKQRVEAMRGSIELHTEPGSGTTFTLKLPLSLSILSTFKVAVGDAVYLLPLESVVECVELPPADPASATGVLDLRGTPLPFVRLRHHFGLESPTPPRESVVVVRHGSTQTGLAVDSLHGATQSVIKPLNPLLGRVAGIAGTALLGDGGLGLIVDIPALVRQLTARAPCS